MSNPFTLLARLSSDEARKRCILRWLRWDIISARQAALLQVARVALKHDVTFAQVMGGGRNKKIIAARFDAYAVLYRDGHSMASIGRMIGGRDHTTVRHGLDRAGVL